VNAFLKFSPMGTNAIHYFDRQGDEVLQHEPRLWDVLAAQHVPPSRSRRRDAACENVYIQRGHDRG
jgi:hypothetical protein